MRIALLVALLGLGSVARLNAARFFVDYAGGSDANAGDSATSPWQHCPGDPAATDNAAAQSLAAGDRVFFKGGVRYVFTATTGIQLRWDGAADQVITYDGNSDESWGQGRAEFTDDFGGFSVTAFFATAARHDLAFKHLDIGGVGGAPSLPVDPGTPVAARFGGGIGFPGGAAGVLIEDCVFHELGYWFAGRPMNAASLAGAAISAADCDGLKISRCDFSRVAIACELSRAMQINRIEIADCQFHDSIVWPVNVPANVAPGAMTVHGCNEFDNAQFDAASWTGYGNSPRLQTVTAPAGQRLVLTASAIAFPAAGFQWQKNGVSLLGATDSILTLDAPTSADSGLYTVIAANALGSASSSDVALAVTPFGDSGGTAGPTDPAGTTIAPAIVAQPAGQTVMALSVATFTVEATGTSLAFQWQKNGTAIPGATNATLMLEAVTINDAANYTVVVANAAGSVLSDVAPLAVNMAPAVSIAPSSQIATPLTTATFVATVSGGPATVLQWRKNGVPLPGATGATLTLQAVTANDEATYTVLAANELGYTVSNDATLRVSTVPAVPPTITDPALSGPGKAVLSVGASPGAFTFTVDGTAPQVLLVRAVGPSLAGLGVTGVLADPELSIYSGELVISQNDNWGGLDYFRLLFTQVGAFPLADGSSKDSTLIVSLRPGTYTAVVDGVNGGTGTVLLEVFRLP